MLRGRHALGGIGQRLAGQKVVGPDVPEVVWHLGHGHISAVAATIHGQRTSLSHATGLVSLTLHGEVNFSFWFRSRLNVSAMLNPIVKDGLILISAAYYKSDQCCQGDPTAEASRMWRDHR